MCLVPDGDLFAAISSGQDTFCKALAMETR
jgi:hypothetical protein